MGLARNAAVLALVGAGWLGAVHAAEPPGPAKAHDYAAASLTAPSTLGASQILAAWHALVVERGLAPDLVDHRDGLALGDWLVRPHVCSASVRYHLVLVTGTTLKAVVVAECSGKGAALDRAASGLAEELAKRLDLKTAVVVTDPKDVPARLWQARLWRGNTEPAAPPRDGTGSPGP